MAVKRFSNSLISQSGQDKVTNFIAGYSPAIDEMDLIARATLSNNTTTSVLFSNIPQTYQHLQIRMIASAVRSDGNPGWWAVFGTFNGDTAASHTLHQMYGNGSVAGAAGYISTRPYIATVNGYSTFNSQMCGTICDILDYTNTSKNKTIRYVSGADRNGAGHIEISSSLWISTAAITSISIDLPSAQLSGFYSQSVFSLYGVIG